MNEYIEQKERLMRQIHGQLNAQRERDDIDSVDASDIDTELAKPKEQEAVELSREQQCVASAINRGRNVMVTGAAGTGKSTLLKALKQQYGESMPVTASTGIAAVNIGGTTLHSWAGLGLLNEPAKRIAGKILGQSNKAPMNRIQGAKRLVIDEISMISGHAFNTVDEVFRLVRKSELPFGGIQIIGVGDFLQLPPVIKSEEERRAGMFAFQCQAWQNAAIATAMLTQVFRQKDAFFSGALNDIRMGDLTPDAKKILNERYQAKDDNPEIRPVVVHTHNADVDSINMAKLACLPGQSFCYAATDIGQEGAKLMLEKNCLAPTMLELKEGAQVMLLWNLSPQHGLANGSVGTIVKFSGLKKLPTVRFANGLEIEIEDQTWEIKSEGKLLASRTQLPLRLAWAITSHKSQGMTLDKIQVHLGKVFEDGQAYVALSRAREASGLFIADGDANAIRANADAVDFYRNAESII